VGPDHGWPAQGAASLPPKAGSDTLPTPMNLHRWWLRISSSCPLCVQHQWTTAHILSGCPKAPEDGRFTWRHGSVLLDIWHSLRIQLDGTHQTYADLPGLRASENPLATIPFEVTLTTSRPDIAIVKRRELHMLELTVCGNTCDALAAAHARKSGKQDYHHLLADARRNDYTTSIPQSRLEHWGTTTQ